MLKNYLKIAWRNLLKRKSNTIINVLGLSTGMAICMLLLLFIQDEWRYDQFHEKKDRIYRLALERKYPGRSTYYSFIPASIGEAAKITFPEIEENTRLFSADGFGSTFIKLGDKIFEEKEVIFADSNFFSVFTAPLLEGDSKTALGKPNSIVLNQSAALKYFGIKSGVLGKTLEIEERLYTITGLVSDWPDHAHFGFNMLISSNTFLQNEPRNYINFSAHTYLLLKENTNATKLEAKLPQIVEKYVAGAIAQNFGQSYEQFIASGNGYRYFLQPLTKIHLTSDMEGELGANGSERSVYIFLVIALFILLIACINFINLSTARSLERAREVGIRKTFGSERKSLIGQFLLESVMVCLGSAIIAVLLVIIFLPSLNNISGKSLNVFYFLQPKMFLLIGLFTLLIGLIAGIYPAFVLSSFKPIEVLRGKSGAISQGTVLRNGLVVFQFASSVILIICTLVVNQQMDYVLSNKLGYKKDHVVTIERTDLLGDKAEAFRNELMKIPGVEKVSGTTAAPGIPNYFGQSFQLKGTTENRTGRGIFTDDAYLDVLSLNLVSGRYFNKSFGTDTLSVLLNEKAVAALGIKGDPIGVNLTTPDEQLNPPDGKSFNTYTVIGVVRDFHFQSLHQQVEPLFFMNLRKVSQVDPLLIIKMKPDRLPETLKAIEGQWNSFIKDRPLNLDFLDQSLARMYQSEQTIRKVFSIFSILAIFIACIGLLGLISYTTQMRTREIGIRKVLGASIGNILVLLGKNFLLIISIASLIAFPIAWWAMHRWLQDFVYRVNIQWWIFLMAGLAALSIALLTISFQALKAAIANPVKSLRTE
jgi:putative ABC transport system permease protein